MYILKTVFAFAYIQSILVFPRICSVETVNPYSLQDFTRAVINTCTTALINVYITYRVVWIGISVYVLKGRPQNHSRYHKIYQRVIVFYLFSDQWIVFKDVQAYHYQ
jgi:hypothetical protein